MSIRMLTGMVRLGLAMLFLAGAAAGAKPGWREAWQSSPASYDPPSEGFIRIASENWHIPPEQMKADLTPQAVGGTIRYRLTVQAAGSQIRVRLSNEAGTTSLHIGAASIGIASDGFAALPGSLHAITFGGAGDAGIPAGAPLVSDPIDLPVKPGTSLVVSVELAAPMMNEGRGGAGFVAAEGRQAMQAVLAGAVPHTGRPLVTGVSVLSDAPPHVVVAFGDSITDGNRKLPGSLHGWPDVLAQRLAARAGGGRYTVVNAGIAGNRVLSNGWGPAALARLDRDALRIEGVSHLILLEGINDINFSGKSLFGNNPELSSWELIAGYRQIIARAHARGVKVYVGTLTPFPGDELIANPVRRALRDDVNRWIRTSGEPDAVIDFDAMLRDAAEPTRFGAGYDSGDHLHPSDAGYKAMGAGIDLSLFP